MGGWGSGPQSSKPDTSQAKRVDIRYMRKHGLLLPGSMGSLRWTRGGEPNGYIWYTMGLDATSLTLDYKVRQHGEDWQSMSYTVSLESIPCRYGGKRQYFRCPNFYCSRRCEVLYSYGVYFVCQQCCGYLYPSQKGDRLNKLLEAKRKIGARIFEDWNGSDGWRKTKGMHWRTFEREYRRLQIREEAWSKTFCERAKALRVEY